MYQLNGLIILFLLHKWAYTNKIGWMDVTTFSTVF